MKLRNLKMISAAVILSVLSAAVTVSASAETDNEVSEGIYTYEDRDSYDSYYDEYDDYDDYGEADKKEDDEGQSGWLEKDSKTYYVSEYGRYLTGYQKIDGEEYYFAANGAMKSGWYTVNGVRMFFAPETGERMTGWIEYNGNRFYVSKSGKAEGMCTIDGNDYYFDGYGILQEGWYEADNSKYYSTFEEGIYRGRHKIDGIEYNFSSSGRFQSGWQDMDGKRVYYDYELAEPVYGWINYNGNIYYSDKESGKITGDQTIDSDEYRFNAQGYLELGFQKFADGVRYYDQEGRIATEWLDLDNKKYYFNSRGLMQTGLKNIGSKKYYFDNSGVMQTGWKNISGKKYYFGNDGSAADGLVNISGVHYYFNGSGIMQTGWQTIKGGKYYFDKKGAMQTGLCTIDGKHYYFSEDDWGGYWGGYPLGQLVKNEPYYYVYINKNGRYVETILRIDKNGIAMTEDDLLNRVKGKPKTSFKIQNIQTSSGGTTVSYLSDNDIKTLKKFADQNFKKDMDGAEKVRTTLEWIHYNTQYARGNDWSEISGCSFVDAIFNHKKGQCAQYNGALIAMMNWLGYDAKLVCGYRGSESKKWQHYWGEVVVDGVTYIMETGNYGSDGSWKHFLTEFSHAGGYLH